MRCIDADALLDEVMDRHCNDCDRRKGIKNGKYRIIYSIGEAPCRACDVDDLKGEIEDVPTIEPQRKKGHWIRHPEQRNIFNGKTIECSECHEKYTVQYVEDEWFCRHCGADMREPEDIPMEYFESGGR